jgi:LacI family transcriptional regulator
MAVTIKDVAKKAGVSYSTVSRALNGIGSEDSDRKRRILRIAEEMGYVKNQAAVSLKLSRTYVIGLYFSTISKMTSPFVLHDVLTGVYSIVGSKYNVVVKGIDMHEAGTLNPTYFDGIIVLSQRHEDEVFMQECINKNIPIVVICREVDLAVPNVATDEALAMEWAMNMLIENGHRRIGVIEGNPELDSTRLRLEGCMRSVRSHGLDESNLHFISGNYRYASGYDGTKKLMEYQPTALLCFNDEMAFGAKQALTEMGLSVPEDVSLIGFDNWDMSGYGNMRLTTVERSMSEIAREGTRVMLDILENGNDTVPHIILDNRLVVRDTVRDIRGDSKR